MPYMAYVAYVAYKGSWFHAPYHKEKLKMAYQWDPEEYARHSQTQFEWARELIAKLSLRGGEALLDIGCGDGKISASIAQALPAGSVLGIDSSREMIELATSRFPKSAYPNLTFLNIDARRIDLPSRFDVAFSNAALHWVAEQSLVLKGVRAALKQSGRLLFQMGGKGNAREILAALDELLAREEWKPFFKDFKFPYAFLSPDEYETLLLEAGLQPVRVVLLPKDMTHAGKEGLAGWIRTTWLPYIQQVPDDLREAFVSELVERYMQAHPPDPAGLVHVKMMRLEVEAKVP